jgi:hypothetical protein
MMATRRRMQKAPPTAMPALAAVDMLDEELEVEGEEVEEGKSNWPGRGVSILSITSIHTLR